MKQFIIIASCSVLLFLTGCTTARITDYQPASPSTSERTAQELGVEVALDPFVESGRTKQYFDIDAVAEGIAILHVRVVNKTADQTFLVEKKKFQLVPNGTGASVTADGKKLEQSSGSKPLWKSLIGIGLEGEGQNNLVQMTMKSQSSEIQRNFVGKEMADQTLSAGQSMEGFIYFSPVKKGEDWSRTTTVDVSLTETKTHQAAELIIPLSQ